MKIGIRSLSFTAQCLPNVFGRAVSMVTIGMISATLSTAAVSGSVTISETPQEIAGNLLQGLLPSEYSSDQSRIGGLEAIYGEASANVSILTDGNAAISSGEPVSNMFAIMSGDVLTYSLGGAYDLTEVGIYLSWRDAGREDFSDVTIEYSMTSGATYVTLFDGFATSFEGVGNQLVIATLRDGGSVIAAGATHVRFTFTDVENGAIGASELVALGTAAIPEPSTAAAVFGALALGFGAYRRRRG